MRICMFALFALALLATRPAVASEEFDPAALAKTVAPFIDESTLAVLHLDATRVEPGKLVDLFGGMIADLEDLGKEHLEEAKMQMNMMRAAFTGAGGKDLFVVVSMADIPYEGPFILVPLPAGANEKVLTAIVPADGRQVQERIGDVLFVGQPKTLARLKSMTPDPRPDLAQAFEAAADTAAQAVLIPPKYSRRVIEEMLPSLPPEIGDGPSSAITRGLTWAVVGAKLGPQLSAKLVIQSQDNQAAKALLAKYADIVRFLDQDMEIRKHIPAFDKPTFDKLARLLTPKVQGDRLTITLNEENHGITTVLSLLALPIQEARMAAKRAASTNNLKQIALAMHNYHDAHKHFPAAASYDADGKLLLSWRVHLLPYLAEENLYKQFHLDEPWDSEHNRKLINQMPSVYRCPASKLREKGRTSYAVVVGEETVFPGREGVPIKEIKDGTSNTILAVEVDDEHAVIWTKPEDLPLDPENPAKGLGGLFRQGCNAAFCDGSVRFLSKDIDPETLRALFTRAGKEVIPRGSY